MLLAVPPRNLSRVLGVFAKEDVEASPIGKLAENKTLQIDYHGEKVAEMDISFLFEPPTSIKTAEHESVTLEEPQFAEPKDLTEVLKQLLSSPNIASKESVVRTYDHEVKGNTVLKPLQGGNDGPNDAAVLKPLRDSWKGIAISCGMNPSYGKIDSYWMAASAVDEAVRNNVAVGGRRIALLDNFTWGNPERPERLGSLVKACEACYDIAKAFKTPFISGKDSLYNESPLGPVTPTLLITALGIVPDVRLTISADAKAPGDSVYIAGQTYHELGGSEYYRLKGFLGRTAPKVRSTQAKRTFGAITKGIDSGLVKSCHDLSEGGLAVAAAEMAFAGGYGMELDLREVPREGIGRDDLLLFSESNSRFLVEVSGKAKKDLEGIMKAKVFSEIGRVTRSPRLSIRGLEGKVIVDAPTGDLLASWKRTLSSGA